MTWPIVMLGDICEIFAGGGAPQLESDFCDDGIPFVRAGSLPKLLNGIQECQLEKINVKTANQYKLKLYSKDAIVFAKSGMSATKGHIYRLKNSCYIVNHLAILKPLGTCIPSYLEHALKKYSPVFLILDPAYPSIRLSDIACFKLPLPPLAEQQRIAEILDKAELVKRNRELAIEKLDELEQSIFEEMFGNPMLNPNGYEIKQLQDLTDPEDTINYGVVQPGDSLVEGIPLIRVGDLVNKKLSAHEIKKIDPVIESAYKRSRLKGTEILLSCVGSIGTVVLATNEMKGFNIARAVARIQLLPKYNRVYIASYLRTNKVQNYFTKELRTVSQPTLNIKQICETPVIIPPVEQQILYARCIEHLEKLRQRYLNSCEIVFKVNESIKFQLFSGSS